MAKLVIPGEAYRLTVRGISATCKLDGDDRRATLYYPRHTLLGNLLRDGATGVRHVAANYIRQAKGWPRGEANMTPIDFVGV